jgi:hypothetical protein
MGGTASAVFSLGSSAGLLVLPALSSDSIVNVDFPVGVLLYRSDIDQFGYYDGIDWIYPAYTSSLTASTAKITKSPRTENRYWYKRSERTSPDYRCRVHSIPILHSSDVQGPCRIIIFDPALKSICLTVSVGRL